MTTNNRQEDEAVPANAAFLGGGDAAGYTDIYDACTGEQGFTCISLSNWFYHIPFILAVYVSNKDK